VSGTVNPAGSVNPFFIINAIVKELQKQGVEYVLDEDNIGIIYRNTLNVLMSMGVSPSEPNQGKETT
jgi:trimethylamine:corrinoid methyltransferase-like protein